MALFKKSEKPIGEERSLIDFVVRSRETGTSDKDIIEELKDKGYGSQQILDTMKKADLKTASSAPVNKLEPLFEDDEELPSHGKEEFPAHTETKLSTSDMEELAEKIIEEKWEGVKKDIDELNKWRDESAAVLEEIKKKIEDVSNNIELIKKSISEKMASYSEGLKDVGADIKAMDMVFKQILPELTSDVKELSSIVGTLKGKKK